MSAEPMEVAPLTSTEPVIESYVRCKFRNGTWTRGKVVATRMNKSEQQIYLHYVGHNKRLDEWVGMERVDLTHPVAQEDSVNLPEFSKMTRNRKRKFDAINHVEKTSEDFGDSALAALEREHEERTKVKNIGSIRFGRYFLEAWYYSPYAEEYTGVDKLYVCEWCLKYMKKKKTLLAHAKTCLRHHPPGDEVYNAGGLSMYEIDGAANKIYCQNLCLLAKLFLDHKTLYYDVEPFMFYVLTREDKSGKHLVGYFSKEKVSVDGYNLACILCLPQYQRQGFGRFLISFSYEISKREKKPGSPEKPLSDLGRISYMSYWTYVILDTLQNYRGNVSVSDISAMTAITEVDVITSLTALNLVKYFKGKHVIYVTPRVIREHLKHFKPPKIPFVEEGFHWHPRPMLPVTSNLYGIQRATGGAAGAATTTAGAAGAGGGGGAEATATATTTATA